MKHREPQLRYNCYSGLPSEVVFNGREVSKSAFCPQITFFLKKASPRPDETFEDHTSANENLTVVCVRLEQGARNFTENKRRRLLISLLFPTCISAGNTPGSAESF